MAREKRTADYRHQMTIQQDTGTSRGTGGEVLESWSTYAIRKGSFQKLGGSEIFRADRTEPLAPYLICFRGDSLTRVIDESMRISFGGRIYNIVSVDDVEGRGFRVECRCRRAPV
jgi:SPP1 family predicted phage head-tail adaptor